MLLSAVKTFVETLAERNIPDDTFIIGVAAVVDRIEGTDERIVARKDCALACDGSSVYFTSAATPATTTDGIQNIFYDDGLGKPPVKLLRKIDVMPPATQTPVGKVLYYDFLSPNIVQLNTYPVIGTLIFRVKAYAGVSALTTLNYAAYRVDYSALGVGILAWLGQYLWQDARAKDWEKSYQEACKGMVDSAILQESDLGNLGDRSKSNVRN